MRAYVHAYEHRLACSTTCSQITNERANLRNESPPVQSRWRSSRNQSLTSSSYHSSARGDQLIARSRASEPARPFVGNRPPAAPFARHRRTSSRIVARRPPVVSPRAVPYTAVRARRRQSEDVLRCVFTVGSPTTRARVPSCRQFARNMCPRTKDRRRREWSSSAATRWSVGDQWCNVDRIGVNVAAESPAASDRASATFSRASRPRRRATTTSDRGQCWRSSPATSIECREFFSPTNYAREFQFWLYIIARARPPSTSCTSRVVVDERRLCVDCASVCVAREQRWPEARDSGDYFCLRGKIFLVVVSRTQRNAARATVSMSSATWSAQVALKIFKLAPSLPPSFPLPPHPSNAVESHWRLDFWRSFDGSFGDTGRCFGPCQEVFTEIRTKCRLSSAIVTASVINYATVCVTIVFIVPRVTFAEGFSNSPWSIDDFRSSFARALNG